MSTPKTGFVVAIDGPAGTGKSSVTKRLASDLGFVHIDTGALYRAVGLASLRQGVDLKTGQQEGVEVIPSVASNVTQISKDSHIQFKYDGVKSPSNRVFLNGDDVTTDIRTGEVSLAASRVSAIPGVRAALLGMQRALGCAESSILEGRDIGTIVFPDADIKFFLVASVDERAKRRLSEIETLGGDVPTFEEIREEIALRDRNDSERAAAPLRKAEDAIEVDTSKLTLDEVVTELKSKIESTMKS